MTNKDYLKQIYINVNAGKAYGKNYTWGYSVNLWLTTYGNIGWEHYGSSCEKNTLKNLNWIIKEIFNMTPSEFVNEYVVKEF